MLCCRAATRQLRTWMKTEARLTLERFARFGCDLDSGTQNLIARATVKVASEKKQRLEREACPRRKRRAATFQGGKHFLSHPLPQRAFSRALVLDCTASHHTCSPQVT